MILQQSGINHIFFPALCYSQARDSLQPVIESSEKILSDVHWIARCPYFQQTTALCVLLLSFLCHALKRSYFHSFWKLTPPPYQRQNLIGLQLRHNVYQCFILCAQSSSKKAIDSQTLMTSQRRCKICWDWVTRHMCYDSDSHDVITDFCPEYIYPPGTFGVWVLWKCSS